VTNLITKDKVTTTWLEGGSVEISSSEWVTVTTQASDFSSAAVFVSVPDLQEAGGGETGFPVSARVRNVLTSVDGEVSFETKLYLANDSFCAKTWYVPQDVGVGGGVRASWIVAEHGAYDVAGSQFIVSEGPITRVNNVPSNDANRITFDYPVGCVSSSVSCAMDASSTLGIMLQLQTVVYDRLLVPRAFLVGTQQSRIVLQPHDSGEASYFVLPEAETLAYMVYESGVSLGCVESSVALMTATFPSTTDETFELSFAGASFSAAAEVPGVFGSVTTCRSLRDATSVRVRSLTSSGVTLNAQEDQCLDEEVRHAALEGMSFLVMGESNTRGSVYCKIALG
jgi:hypothetical protein